MKKLALTLSIFLILTSAWSHDSNHTHRVYTPDKTTLCFDYNDGSTAGKLTQAIAILSDKNCGSFTYWGHYHLGNDGRPLLGDASFIQNISQVSINPNANIYQEKQQNLYLTFEENFNKVNQKIQAIETDLRLVNKQASRIEELEQKILTLEASIKKDKKLLEDSRRVEKELLKKNKQAEKELEIKKRYDDCLDKAQNSNDLLECTRVN